MSCARPSRWKNCGQIPGQARNDEGGGGASALRLCIFGSEQMCRYDGEYGGVGRMQFAKGAVKMYIVEDLWP